MQRRIEFPAIAVNDIDGVSGKEVIIVSKSRLLAFSENGTRLYYTQYVDSGGSFTRYNADADAGGVQGRRYGHIQIVNDLNGDGVRDLVVVADALSLNPAGINATFAIVQAFALQRSGGNGYLAPLTPPVQVLNANSGLTPDRPQPGITVNGIRDLDGNGVPEVVVSDTTRASIFFATCLARA